MEGLASLFSWVMTIMSYEIVLFGFTFSFWQIFVFTIVASIVAWFLSEVFLGE